MKLYFWELFFNKKVEKIAPKNRFMRISFFARSHFSCVFGYYRGNNGVGINSIDVILVVGDSFYTLSDPLFGDHGYCDKKNKKSLVSVKISNSFFPIF